MAVLDKMLSNLGSLFDDELVELMSRLEVEKAGREKFDGAKGLIPHCGSVSVVKCGKKDGKQRYKCKEDICGRTFMQTTCTMFSHTRPNREQWLELLRGMVEGLSINKIAKNIGTSGKTVWYNEKKVISILMEVFGEQDDFIDIAECDEEYAHGQSFRKGCHLSNRL